MRFICGAGFGLIGRVRFDVIVYSRHPRNLRFQLRVSVLSQLPLSRCRFGITAAFSRTTGCARWTSRYMPGMEWESRLPTGYIPLPEWKSRLPARYIPLPEWESSLPAG